jgi:hypothetical protein
MNNAQPTTVSDLFTGDVFIALDNGKLYTFEGIEGTELWATDENGSTFSIERTELVKHIACNI